MSIIVKNAPQYDQSNNGTPLVCKYMPISQLKRSRKIFF